MPLYDYQCPKCNKHFELLIKLENYTKAIPCKYCKTYLERVCIKPPRVASWNNINGAKVM